MPGQAREFPYQLPVDTINDLPLAAHPQLPVPFHEIVRPMKFLTTNALRFPLLLLLPAMATATDWNQWRGPHRSGATTEARPMIETLPAAGLQPRWIAVTDIPSARSGGWSSPIVAKQRAYLFTHHKVKLGEGKLGKVQFPFLPAEKRTGMTPEEYEDYERKRRNEQETRSNFYRFDEVLYCLDARTGKPAWTNKRSSHYTRFPQSGSPAVIGDSVLVLGAGRLARCLNARDGSDRWQTKLPGDFRDQHMQSSFAVVGKVAVVLCGNLYGLDLENGAVLWQAGDSESRQFHSSPVTWNSPQGPRVIVNVDGHNTICVDPQSGETAWQIRSDTNHSTPVVTGNRLLTYGSSRKKGLRCYQLAPEQAELSWTYQGTADPGSSPVVVGNHVYVQGERRLACVQLDTGKQAWMTQLDLNKPRYTSLVAVNQQIFYVFESVISFTADSHRFQPRMQARINNQGLLAEETTFRKQYQIDELEKTTEGQKEAEQIWRKEFANGPLPCATPAVANGCLYVRLKNGLACYDLSLQSTGQPAN